MILKSMQSRAVKLKSIKSAHSGFRDQVLGMMGILIKSFQLQTDFLCCKNSVIESKKLNSTINFWREKCVKLTLYEQIEKSCTALLPVNYCIIK